jgi:transcriptional regulator with XRE-family HTH domain
MGYSGKLLEKHKAIALRKKGYSYSEILKKLHVSKDTISHWCRDVKLNRYQKLRLYKKKYSGGLGGCIIGAKKKQKEREELTKKLIKKGKKEIGYLSKRDKFIAGIAMYFAEGDKADGDIGFSNSDPRAIKFMVGWLKEICKIPSHKLKASLYIHDNLDERKARWFWSGLTGIPLENFTKSYIVKNNPHRLRKVKHIYGVLKIRIGNVILHRKMRGWISGVFK